MGSPIHRESSCRTGRTPEYTTWVNMNERCSNSSRREWKYYGGRGIVVCTEWRHNYPAFLAYVGRRPSSKHSIDRFPNNDGNYEPGNVRWATWKEQQRNKRSNRLVDVHGRTVPLIEAAEITGLTRECIAQRIDNGAPAEDIFRPVTPLQRFMFEGEPRTMMEISAITEIQIPTLWRWLQDYDTADAAVSACRANKRGKNQKRHGGTGARSFTLLSTTLSVNEWSAKIGIPVQTLVSRRHHGWTDAEAILTPKGVHREHVPSLEPSVIDATFQKAAAWLRANQETFQK